MSPYCWLECFRSLESTVALMKSQKSGMTIEDSSHHHRMERELYTPLN